MVASGAPPAKAPVVASATPDANGEPTTAPVWRHWACVGRSDAARLRHRRAGMPALRWAFAFDCHGRRPRRDSRDLGRCCRVAGAGGSGAAVRAGAEHQPRCGNRGLSTSRRRLRRGRFARVAGRFSPRVQRSVVRQKSLDRPFVRAVAGGGTREPAAAVCRPCRRAAVPRTAVPSTWPLSRLCSAEGSGFPRVAPFARRFSRMLDVHEHRPAGRGRGHAGDFGAAGAGRGIGGSRRSPGRPPASGCCRAARSRPCSGRWSTRRSGSTARRGHRTRARQASRRRRP